MGLRPIRTKGPHVRLKAEDGRVTTVPVHGTRIIPRGLLRKIIREDLELRLEESVEEYPEYKREKRR